MPNHSKPAHNTEVVHPGVILDQVLKERGMSQKDLSDAIGKSTPVINDIIKRRRSISPEIAFMLEAVIEDIPAIEWLSYQSEYDLAMIQQNEEVAKRKENLEAWNQLKILFNASYLKKKLGLIGTPEENVEKIYQFFGVDSITALRDKAVYTESYFRKSTTQGVDPANLMTWMLMVRKTSNDQDQLKTKFDQQQVHRLIRELNDVFYQNVNTVVNTERVLNKFGIKLVVESHLEKTPVDGYSFWDGENPTIAVTMRYRRLDNFAFAIMHELGHIVKHIRMDKKKDFIDIIKRDIEEIIEIEANIFAEKALMADAPLENLFEQLKRSPFTAKGPILRAAKTYEINPGIITGQFQHYCGTYSACRDLLTNIN